MWSTLTQECSCGLPSSLYAPTRGSKTCPVLQVDHHFALHLAETLWSWHQDGSWFDIPIPIYRLRFHCDGGHRCKDQEQNGWNSLTPEERRRFRDAMEPRRAGNFGEGEAGRRSETGRNPNYDPLVARGLRGDIPNLNGWVPTLDTFRTFAGELAL